MGVGVIGDGFGVAVAAAEGVSIVLAADGMGDLADAVWWEGP